MEVLCLNKMKLFYKGVELEKKGEEMQLQTDKELLQNKTKKY